MSLDYNYRFSPQSSMVNPYPLEKNGPHSARASCKRSLQSAVFSGQLDHLLQHLTPMRWRCEGPMDGKWTLNQWEFQDPKIPYKVIFSGDIPLHRPYIGLVYGRYLQFRILKWPLIEARNHIGTASENTGKMVWTHLEHWWFPWGISWGWWIYHGGSIVETWQGHPLTQWRF